MNCSEVEGVGVSLSAVCLTFPMWLLTFPLCIISPENMALGPGALLWPCSLRQCHRALINADTAPVSRAQAPLCVYE